MFEYIIKKWIIGKINDLLEDNKNNVDKIKEILSTWITRFQSILTYLESTMKKVDDHTITEDELNECVAEVEKVIKEW